MNERGGGSYRIVYHRLVVEKDIQRLDKTVGGRIKKTIELKLATRPDIFGEPLRKSLKGYRKLRVGDYRVVFKIRGGFVFVLLIEHRSVVYREIHKIKSRYENPAVLRAAPNLNGSFSKMSR